MPVLSFANQKGGVGKTTSAVNAAACLGASGYKVLLVDIDPQGSTTSGVGLSKKGLAGSSYDLLIGRASPANSIRAAGFAGLYIIPANLDLAAAEFELPAISGREYLLKTALDLIKDRYDYIIIDCPPSLGLLTINALTASDSVIIPMQCEFYALEGLTQLTTSLRNVKKLYNPELTIGGIIITMYNAQLNLTKQVVEELRKYYPDKLFGTFVPRNVKLSEAPSFGMPVMYYDHSSPGAKAYAALAAEIAERLPPARMTAARPAADGKNPSESQKTTE